MKIIVRTLGIAIWFLAFGATAQDQKVTDAAISILHAAQPEVEWDAKTAVSADVTCDGKSDTAIVGYVKSEAVWLGVVAGNNDNKASKPVVMKFLVGKHSQDSFCAIPVQIETHPIDCDGDEGETLPGCKKVKGCSDFSLVDNSCDSFNFYWDSSRKKLAWWRR
jgi:hypothetical protein